MHREGCVGPQGWEWFVFGTGSALQRRLPRRRRMGLIFWKTGFMKIVWRNSNPIEQNPISVACTGSSDESGQVRRFYRSRAGLGILGTNFELWVNCKRSSSAA
jgi:hypothetical protein